MQHRSKSSKYNIKIPLWTKVTFIFSIILFIFIGDWVSYGTTLATTHLSPTFSYVEFLQPPTEPFDLLLPIILVAYICILLPFIPSNNWTRLIIKIILLILLFRYSTWRVTTLNFNQASIIFSIFIYVIEALSLITFIIYSLQSIWSSAKKRSAEADKYVQDISFGKYITSVDVFIPTHNETEQAIYRTVIGCQAINYPSKKVYILDATCREHIRDLAEKLGCEYITHSDNKRTKAENINEALPQTNGELILIMDAGYVPLNNFLMRTIGFFEKPNVALVQTPQIFYNADKNARNFRIESIVRNMASYSGFSQSCHDVFNSVLCCGSYVVRRTALESVGDLTKFLGESPTSAKMLTLGWRIVHLSEVLSIGESTRTYRDLIEQRVRWHHRNYEIFYGGDTIPIWSKLNFWQKSYFLTLYISNFAAFFRAILILSPIVALFLGTSPIIATPIELVYYLLPYLWLMIGSYSWSTEYSTSFLWNEVSETILCYPLLESLIFTVRNSLKLQFNLDRKLGTGFIADKYSSKLAHEIQKPVKAENKNYNLAYIFGLLISIIAMVAALYWHLTNHRVSIWQTATSSEFGLMFFILVYNIAIVGIALFTTIDQSERRTVHRFPLQTGCRVVAGSRIFIGYTNNLSEGGVEITLIDSKWVRDDNTGIFKFIPSSSGEELDFPRDIELVKVEFLEHSLSVEGKLVRQRSYKKQYNLALEFTNVSLEENRQLVKMLYCDRTLWKRTNKI